MADETRLPVLDGLLVAQRLRQRVLWVARAHEVKDLRPERLAGDQLCIHRSASASGPSVVSTNLDPVLPFTVPVMPHEHKCTYFVRDARVATKLRLDRARLESPVKDVPVLLLERLPRAPGNLLAQLGGLARFGVAEVYAGVLALEEGRVQDVRAGVLEWGERGGLAGDFGEDMEVLGELEGAGLR